MSDGFEVDPSELTSHARTLSGIAAGVAECRAAADQEGVGGLIYGDLFDPTIRPLLEMARGHLAHLISAAAGVGQAISVALGGNADSYTSIDNAAQQSFGSIQSAIPIPTPTPGPTPTPPVAPTPVGVG